MSVEMKDSGIAWIGEIPVHWKVSSIKRNFTLFSGATPKTDNEHYWNGNVAWITPADYKTEDRWIECGSRYISDLGFKSCAVTMLPKGSIIFSKRAPIGLVIMNSKPLCTNQGCIGCIPQKANGSYYYYAMSVYTEQFDLLGSGTTFKEISATSFANFMLPTPSLEEQSRIANFLDKKCAEIDELIALQEQMIAQLTTYKQAVITETVTKGLDPNVKMKDSGVEWIGEIPEHWEVKKLKQNSVFINGFAFDSEDFILEDGVRVIRIGDIGFKADFENCVRARTNPNLLIPYRIKDRDILIAMSGATTGKTCFVDNVEEAYINQRVCIIRSEISKIIYYSLQTPYFIEYVNLKNFGAAQPNISSKALREYSITVMPISEQCQIVNFLDQKCKEIDELISIKKEKIEQLKSYKKSVIYEYVTGKKLVGI